MKKDMEKSHEILYQVAYVTTETLVLCGLHQSGYEYGNRLIKDAY